MHLVPNLNARRSLVLLLVLGMTIGAVSGLAIAKKKKKAKPVKTTLFLHGKSPSGELDGAQWLADNLANGTNNPNTMDASEPASDPAPKSQALHNPAFNPQCAGLPSGFPTWLAEVKGTIKGDATLKLHVAAGPATTMTARLWTDVLPGPQSCNAGYVEPLSEVTLDVPAGQNELEIKFKKLNAKATQYVLLEVLGGRDLGQGRDVEPARVFYDSSDFASQLEFKCIPAKGKTCSS